MLEFMQFELQSFFNQQSALIHSYSLQQCLYNSVLYIFLLPLFTEENANFIL